jgi:hypothetical protein
VVFDWQLAGRCRGTQDLAYLLSSSVATQVLRDNWDPLVRRYHARLLAAGVAGYDRHQAFPAEQEAEVRLSIAGMFALSSDLRAEECRQALALPGLQANLRARHLALLFHNLVTAGRGD